ncbi:hypothetical protein HOD29_00860 [archaeon]|jgi:hypothetical protein|nr:hypothetical protein [archaeon]
MGEKSLIHIKLQYEEAVETKKDILSSEINLLNLIKIIRKYKDLRKKELENKIKIQRKVKQLKANINKLQKTLPKLKIPNIIKKEERATKEVTELRKEIQADTIESQLQKIQRKLRLLEK